MLNKPNHLQLKARIFNFESRKGIPLYSVSEVEQTPAVAADTGLTMCQKCVGSNRVGISLGF